MRHPKTNTKTCSKPPDTVLAAEVVVYVLYKQEEWSPELTSDWLSSTQSVAAVPPADQQPLRLLLM